MVYNIQELMRDVRVCLDQNMTSDQLLQTDDVDTLAFDDIIRSKIVNAARIVMQNAPLLTLGAGIPFGKSISWESAEGHGCGSVLLPDDFLRLVIFQMSDWSRGVSEAITVSNPRYALQRSRYAGMRGCPQKPVVAIVNTGVGMILEFYSCSGGKGTCIKQASYIPEPRELDGQIFMSHRIKDAVVYYAAYMVALTIGQTEQAQSLLSVSNALLNDTAI